LHFQHPIAGTFFPPLHNVQRFSTDVHVYKISLIAIRLTVKHQPPRGYRQNHHQQARQRGRLYVVLGGNASAALPQAGQR
jgi:hypothetical protein